MTIQKYLQDIKTPVKYASLELNQLFSQVEQTMTAKFVEREFPKEFQEIYMNDLVKEKIARLKGKFWQLLIRQIYYMNHLEKSKKEIQKNYF